MLVFVGGISGIGKSTLIAGLPGLDADWLWLSASALIKEELKVSELPTSEDARIMEYQAALVRGFRRRRLASVPIVMDGHFSLPTKDGFKAIPTDVFRELDPSYLILLHADPSTIEQRLFQRDSIAPSATEISDHMAYEAAAARQVAKDLSIRLQEIEADETAGQRLLALIQKESE